MVTLENQESVGCGNVKKLEHLCPPVFRVVKNSTVMSQKIKIRITI